MIAVQGLTKCFGPVLAVDGLTFDVAPGRVTGFLGPNGAGKTTTMRLMLGLHRPTAGRVTFGGVEYRAMRYPLRRVGGTLESVGAHPRRSAYSHLLALAHASGIAAGRVEEVLGLVGLHDAARRRVGEFSLGMTQRLGVAAALLGDPEVLVLDEPGNGLDPEGIVWMRTLLRSLAAQGRTVFVSSHLMAEMALADHLVVIAAGRLVADTGVGEFVRSAAAARVRVRSPQRDRLAGLLRAAGAVVEPDAGGALLVGGSDATAVGEVAARHGVVLNELVVHEVSLEEAFMDLIRDRADARRGASVVGEEARR
jgi:ABC-2 type transport system ATP-binding protein